MTATTTSTEILFVLVNYKSEADTLAFLERYEQAPAQVRFAIADNSPQSTSDAFRSIVTGRDDVAVCAEYADNPGYFGAASRLLRELENTVEVSRAVIVTNVDLDFEHEQLSDYLDRQFAGRPDGKWILSPDITEAGLRTHLNPHGLDPSISPEQQLQRRIFRSDFWYGALRTLRLLKLRLVDNSAEVARADGVRVSSTYGAMFILGPGFFRAGGFIPEMPLFGEEYAIARQSQELDVPIYFDASFKVHHSKSRSTGLLSAGERRSRAIESWRAYAKWEPKSEYGSMAWLAGA